MSPRRAHERRNDYVRGWPRLGSFWTAQLISSYRLSISPRRFSSSISRGRGCGHRSFHLEPCAIARPIVIALIVDTEDASRDHRARRRLGASSGEVGLTLALIRSPEVSLPRRVLSQGALTA